MSVTSSGELEKSDYRINPFITYTNQQNNSNYQFFLAKCTTTRYRKARNFIVPPRTEAHAMKSIVAVSILRK